MRSLLTLRLLLVARIQFLGFFFKKKLIAIEGKNYNRTELYSTRHAGLTGVGFAAWPVQVPRMVEQRNFLFS
jgi:hypothetical protein